jgi:hypothetical protein
VYWYCTEFTADLMFLYACSYGSMKIQLWKQKEWNTRRTSAAENLDNVNSEYGFQDVQSDPKFDREGGSFSFRTVPNMLVV